MLTKFNNNDARRPIVYTDCVRVTVGTVGTVGKPEVGWNIPAGALNNSLGE